MTTGRWEATRNDDTSANENDRNHFRGAEMTAIMHIALPKS